MTGLQSIRVYESITLMNVEIALQSIHVYQSITLMNVEIAKHSCMNL